jgi:class 3 adenylate cyclase/tetratricopeptide (TPR) repeat protein
MTDKVTRLFSAKGFKRKLTAILHADVKGYSRLMGEDEEATVSTLSAYRAVMGELIQKHRGHAVHGSGDSLLAEFVSVVDAVRCAVEIQEELKTRNAELPENRKIEFRIGINLGDVIEEDGDLHGDGVNIAARVEALAEGGGICITRTVYDQVKNKLSFGYEYLGEHSVKNITEPVRVYRMRIGPEDAPPVMKKEKVGRRRWLWAGLAAMALLVIATISLVLLKSQGPSLDPKRVVVAFFENRTGDSKLDPIGGMTADWITQGLSQTGIVYVEPLPPAEALEIVKESKDPVRSLAKETGAGKVISGSYYLQGGNISLHAQIMDVQKGKILSALDPVSGPVDNPVKAIESLRKRVVGALAISIDERIGAYIDVGAKPPTYEAYREFLEGQRAFFRREFREAIKYYDRAIELDPDFMPPVIWTAYAYLSRREYVELEFLLRELDKSRDKLIPKYRYSLDYFEARLRGDHEAAYNANIQRAIARGQQKNKVRGAALASGANRINRPKEAIEFLKRMDPESGQDFYAKKARIWVGYWNQLTKAHHMLGNHEQELKEARRGRKYHPKKPRTLLYELRALSALGRIKEVNKLIDESLTLPPHRRRNPGWIMQWAARELRAHGYRQESLQVIEWTIKWFESMTEEESEKRRPRHILGQMLYEAERWEEAQDVYEALHEDFPDRIGYLGRLGGIAAWRGDKEEALEISSLLEDIDEPYIFGSHTWWRARIAAILGEKENAVKLLREALAQGRMYHIHLHPVIDFEPLQDYPPFKELIKPKG